ncbi:hypothetical protein LCGC14_3068310, partial [marine sediment metagenome]
MFECSKTSYTNYDLPEAYKGKNLFLRDTIDGLIMDAKDEWYTTAALPWAQTDQMHIQWNEFHFNRRLVDRVPHEGISRLVTSSKRQFRTHVVRHGIAFVMEADFYRTPDGITQYQRNVLGIAQSVQETQDHDTVYALLTSKNYFRLWEEMYGRMGFSYEKLLDDEIANYAAVIQDANKLQLIYEHAKRIMRKIGVIPDLFILPPKLSIYLTKAQDTKIEYWIAGPEGPQLFKNGPKALSAMYDGISTVETRDFTVYEDRPAVQLLTRAVNIGEYYGMLANDFRKDDITDYQTRWRDTWLYDENKDNFVKITFYEAFCNANLFG